MEFELQFDPIVQYQQQGQHELLLPQCCLGAREARHDAYITMQTRSLLRATFDIGRTPPLQLPPTFLLPCRAHLHQAAASSPTQFRHTPPEIPAQSVEGPFGATAHSEAQIQPTRLEPTPWFLDTPEAFAPRERR